MPPPLALILGAANPDIKATIDGEIVHDLTLIEVPTVSLIKRLDLFPEVTKGRKLVIDLTVRIDFEEKL